MGDDNKVNEDKLGAGEDYPLSEVPMEARTSLSSIAMVLLGFTFFTSTMWAGAELGVSYKFWPDLVLVMVAGNLLLGIYAAIMGFIAYKTGLSSVLLSRFALGDKGSKWADFLFGFTQVGWYAWGTATMAIVLIKLIKIPSSLTIPLMIFFGVFFAWTAHKGFKGLEVLSTLAVPVMIILIALSTYIGTKDVGGFQELNSITPTQTMGVGTALTLIFGTFVSGATQSTNWTRFAKTSSAAIWATLLAFFFGNGLMIFAGAYGAYVYQEADIVLVLAMQGLTIPALLMLTLNIWTTQGNQIYSFSVAGCNFFRTDRRQLITIIGAGIGTVLALAGMYKWLLPYIEISGTIIPPIGGVIIADFFIKNKGNYPKLDDVKIKEYNYTGIITYILGAIAAFFSPGIAAINGILIAFILYPVVDKILDLLNVPQKHIVKADN